MPDVDTRKSAPAIPPSAFQTQAPFVAFNPQNVPPAQAFYFQLNDFLFLRFLANLVTTFNFNFRYLTPTGEIKESSIPVTTLASGIGSFKIPLAEFWLLSFAATPTVALPASSWIHLQVGIARGPSSAVAPQFHGLIWQGYLYNNSGNGWPGTPTKECWDGPGTPRGVLGTQPGAGVDIAEIVPANRRWRVLSFFVQLTTSAIVANRIPQFIVSDGARTFFTLGPAAAIPASKNTNFNFTPALQSFVDANGNIVIPAPPDIELKSAGFISTSTVGIQVTDQWQAPQYEILEWASYDS